MVKVSGDPGERLNIVALVQDPKLSGPRARGILAMGPYLFLFEKAHGMAKISKLVKCIIHRDLNSYKRMGPQGNNNNIKDMETPTLSIFVRLLVRRNASSRFSIVKTE